MWLSQGSNTVAVSVPKFCYVMLRCVRGCQLLYKSTTCYIQLSMSTCKLQPQADHCAADDFRYWSIAHSCKL